MNKVFPRKWHDMVCRDTWAHGPWDTEAGLDREQWADPITSYPCLAIRSDLGIWNGYVGVDPGHPAYGIEFDDIEAHGGITWHCFTNKVQYIEQAPEEPGACVNPADPKSVMDVCLMPDQLWFFGFDAAHAGDVLPVMTALGTRAVRSHTWPKSWEYRDINYVKNECAKIAIRLEEHRRIVLGMEKGTPLSRRYSDS